MDKIDTDKDGQVSKDELLKWIEYVQHKYLETDAARQWDEIGHTGEKMTWEEYREKSYGGLDGRCFFLEIRSRFVSLRAGVSKLDFFRPLAERGVL